MLGALGAAYAIGGFFFALIGEVPQDFHRRWIENGYFVRGVSSLDVWEGTQPVAPDVGAAHPGGYPPWSLVISLFAVPPLAEGVVRVYFAALNVGALFLLVRFAHGIGARFGKNAARLLAASVLAVAANAVVLRHGQYGLLVNASLILMFGAVASGRPSRGGLYLALASLKPQTAGPFALLFLNRKGVVALAIAGAFALLSTFAVSAWLERSPQKLIGQVFGHAAVWEGGDAGILHLLLATGLPRGKVIPGLMLVSLLAGVALLLRYRARSVLVRVAILAVVGRLWTYHRRYDDVMLVFLLLALGESALERRNARAWLAFAAVGVSLWLPFRENDHGALLIALKVAIWIYGLIELLRHSAPEAAPN